MTLPPADTFPALQALRASSLCRCVPPQERPRTPKPGCILCRGTGLRDRDREKVVDHNRDRRIPTPDDFAAFDGQHCRLIFQGLPPDWRCPGCARTTFEILRWTLRFPHRPDAFYGWVGGYHKHHDHSGDHLQFNGPYGRFPATVVCEQCNSADSAAKRKLKLPAWFSFSPAEIRAFVSATPHGKHLIDYVIARQIYTRLHSTAMSAP